MPCADRNEGCVYTHSRPLGRTAETNRTLRRLHAAETKRAAVTGPRAASAGEPRCPLPDTGEALSERTRDELWGDCDADSCLLLPRPTRKAHPYLGAAAALENGTDPSFSLNLKQ